MGGEEFSSKVESPSDYEIQELVARAEANLRDWLKLFELGLFHVGDRDSFEILLEKEGQPVREVWDNLFDEQRQIVVQKIGEILGVELLDIQENQVINEYKREGVVGELTEGGAEVRVLRTRFPGLGVHILDYKNPQLGTRYDLVRIE